MGDAFYHEIGQWRIHRTPAAPPLISERCMDVLLHVDEGVDIIRGPYTSLAVT
jgi:hypothetical protein